MARRRPRFRTRHVVAISVGGMLLGYAIAVGLLVTMMRTTDAVDARSVVTMGTIGRMGFGRNGDYAEVIWRDGRDGKSRTALFRFSDPGEWHTGEPFGVRYDPRDPSARVFASADYADYVDDGRDEPVIALVLASIGFVLCAVPWLSHGVFNLRARYAEASEWRAWLCLDTKQRSVSSVIVLLAPVDGLVRGRDLCWQRVLWSPALAGLSGEAVRVRIWHGIFGRAVVEAPDGSRIWPAGRLRSGPPASPVVWPRSWGFKRPRVWVFWLIAFAVIPPAIDLVSHLGRREFGLDGFEAVAFVLFFYALFLGVWGLTGGVFARVPWGTEEFTLPTSSPSRW